MVKRSKLVGKANFLLIYLAIFIAQTIYLSDEKTFLNNYGYIFIVKG